MNVTRAQYPIHMLWRLKYFSKVLSSAWHTVGVQQIWFQLHSEGQMTLTSMTRKDEGRGMVRLSVSSKPASVSFQRWATWNDLLICSWKPLWCIKYLQKSIHRWGGFDTGDPCALVNGPHVVCSIIDFKCAFIFLSLQLVAAWILKLFIPPNVPGCWISYRCNLSLPPLFLPSSRPLPLFLPPSPSQICLSLS